jgi:hypothetical protein
MKLSKYTRALFIWVRHNDVLNDLYSIYRRAAECAVQWGHVLELVRQVGRGGKFLEPIWLQSIPLYTSRLAEHFLLPRSFFLFFRLIRP